MIAQLIFTLKRVYDMIFFFNIQQLFTEVEVASGGYLPSGEINIHHWPPLLR